MSTYQVEIKETLARVVTVEAKSSKEAVRLVGASYKAGNPVLDSEDYIDTEINLFDSETT